MFPSIQVSHWNKQKILWSVLSNQSQVINMRWATIQHDWPCVSVKGTIFKLLFGGNHLVEMKLSPHLSVDLCPLPTEGAVRPPSKNKPPALLHTNHKTALRW